MRIYLASFDGLWCMDYMCVCVCVCVCVLHIRLGGFASIVRRFDTMWNAKGGKRRKA